MNKQAKIGIIGAGYTGLVLAYRLAKAGNQVTILEASSELGGLAGGFTLHGENIEKAYHHLFRTDTDIIELINELDIEDKLEWHKSSMAVFYDNKMYPFMGALDLLKFSPLSLLNRVRAGLVILYLQKSKNWEKLMSQTAYAWMKKWAGNQVVQVIWGPLLKGKFAQFYDKISMAWLWARVHIRANSRERGGEKLGYLKGGFNSITNALAKRLEDLGVEILLKAPVKEIQSLSDYEVKVFTENASYNFNKLIATVPSGVFGKLIAKNPTATPLYQEQLQSIDYLGAVIGVFSSKQKISDYYWHNINNAGSPFLVFLNHTSLIPRARYQNNYIYYIGAYLPHDHIYFQESEDKVWEEWLSYLKSLFPNFQPEEILEKHMFKLRNAQHVVNTDYLSKIPEYRTPIPGVYLANFSQIFPEDRGTNYSVREANKLVEYILADLNNE